MLVVVYSGHLSISPVLPACTAYMTVGLSDGRIPYDTTGSVFHVPLSHHNHVCIVAYGLVSLTQHPTPEQQVINPCLHPLSIN